MKKYTHFTVIYPNTKEVPFYRILPLKDQSSMDEINKYITNYTSVYFNMNRDEFQIANISYKKQPDGSMKEIINHKEKITI